MQTISDMVIRDESAADIGTDHGYIPAYLLNEGICSKVILTDIAEGPLQRAKAHFEEYGIDADFRLGPGLEVIDIGEVSTVIIAGMGGETIIDILNKDLEKSHSFKRIILQPRTFIGKLRVWLSDNGFKFTDYALCRERNQIVEVMAVEPGIQKTENALVSSFLIQKGDPFLKEYLENKLRGVKNILEEFKNSKNQNSQIKAQFEIDALYLTRLLKEMK